MALDCGREGCQRTEWYDQFSMILCERCKIWCCPDCAKCDDGTRIGLCIDCQVDQAVHYDHMEDE